MSIGHIAVRPHSRAQGHSVAAAVAYRCGLALTCERTGARHDFTRRSQREDVAAFGLVRGRFESPAAFAAAVESAEKRRNSRLCRDVQMALPAELDDHARIKLTEVFAAELAKRYETAACWAVHRPDRRSDDRNHHSHIVLPTRVLAGDGCTFGKKIRVLDDLRRGPEEIIEIRRLWEARANEALLAAGQDATVHTGRTTNPAPTLGASHTAIERRAWQQRRTDFPNGLERAGGLSAARLVIDDGECATRRGRALAVHARQRALGLSPESRPVRPSVPDAVQGLTHAVVAVSPEPEPHPIRPRAPDAVQGLTHAVVAVSPEPEPRPICVPDLTAIMERLKALSFKRRMAARQALERRERQRMEHAAEQKLVSAFSPEGIEKVGEELIKEHVGYSNAYPSFSGLGGRANEAALDVLRPHARPHYVAEKRRFKPGMAGRDYLRHLKALNAAIERWRRWWRGGSFSTPQDDIIPEMIRTVRPVHWEETQDKAENAMQAAVQQADANRARARTQAHKREARERRDEQAAVPVPRRPKPNSSRTALRRPRGRETQEY